MEHFPFLIQGRKQEARRIVVVVIWVVSGCSGRWKSRAGWRISSEFNFERRDIGFLLIVLILVLRKMLWWWWWSTIDKACSLRPWQEKRQGGGPIRAVVECIHQEDVVVVVVVYDQQSTLLTDAPSLPPWQESGEGGGPIRAVVECIHHNHNHPAQNCLFH